LQTSADGTGWTSCTGTQYCQYFPKTESTQLGAYVQDEMRTGALTTIAGLRLDSYELKPKASAKYDAQAIANGQPAVSSRDSASPRLAFLEVTPAFIPYIQYARGFRSPSPQEINSFFNNTVYRQISNPDLKPETSNTVEVGLRGKLAAGPGALRYSAAAYKGNYRNFIDLVTVRGNLTVANRPSSSAARGQGRDSRAGRAHRLRARQWLHRQGRLRLDQGHHDGQWRGAGLESVAPLSVVTGLRYERPSNGSCRATWSTTRPRRRKTFRRRTNFVSPSFFVMDLSGGYHLTRNMTVTAGIRNLFDRKYWSWTDIRGLSLADSAVNKDAYTEPGRSFNVSLKIAYRVVGPVISHHPEGIHEQAHHRPPRVAPYLPGRCWLRPWPPPAARPSHPCPNAGQSCSGRSQNFIPEMPHVNSVSKNRPCWPRRSGAMPCASRGTRPISRPCSSVCRSWPHQGHYPQRRRRTGTQRRGGARQTR
jgi:hemoglobin/transferrin/lactoferrin receptor protein